MRLRCSRSTRWLCSSAIGSGTARSSRPPRVAARDGRPADPPQDREGDPSLTRRDLGGTALVASAACAPRVTGSPMTSSAVPAGCSTSMITISGAASMIALLDRVAQRHGRRRAAVAAAEQAQVHRARRRRRRRAARRHRRASARNGRTDSQRRSTRASTRSGCRPCTSSRLATSSSSSEARHERRVDARSRASTTRSSPPP